METNKFARIMSDAKWPAPPLEIWVSFDSSGQVMNIYREEPKSLLNYVTYKKFVEVRPDDR